MAQQNSSLPPTQRAILEIGTAECSSFAGTSTWWAGDKKCTVQVQALISKGFMRREQRQPEPGSTSPGRKMAVITEAGRAALN